MEKQWVNMWAELCDSTEADDENSYVYDGPKVDERIKELEERNAILTAQLAAAEEQLKQIYQIIYDTKSGLGIK